MELMHHIYNTKNDMQSCQVMIICICHNTINSLKNLATDASTVDYNISIACNISNYSNNCLI